MSSWSRFGVALVFAVGGGLADAQQAAPTPSAAAKPPPLLRIESGVADVDPLGTSLRQLSVDLRQPVGFAGVYQVPASRSPTGRAAFARMSGATAAVFDKSMYVSTRDGLRSSIPAGTTFYIGGLPEKRPVRGAEISTAFLTAENLRAPDAAETTSVAGSPRTYASPDPKESAMAAVAADTAAAAARVATQWPHDGASAADAAPATPDRATGILEDEAYRGTRVAQLLRQAAGRIERSTPQE